MALLTGQQIDVARQGLSAEMPGQLVGTKSQLNAAIQAVEDTFESAALQNAINNAINDATTPLVLSAEIKRKLVRWWLKSRFDRGN